MRWLLAFFLALTPCAVSSAVGCSCPRLKDPEKQANREEAQREASVKLKVLTFAIQRNEDGEATGESSAVVVEQPENGERYPEKITVHSWGGDEGANCGAASLLFQAVSSRRDIRVNLSREADGAYGLTPCALRQIDPWR
ncbi:MAG TPA: hypothetical protein VK446_02930 [Methylocystis sp.]|nr:hypothetical protein [Methylocystis sp.]